MLDAVTIANDLVARDLIPPAVASEVTELATKEQKGVKLVECVLSLSSGIIPRAVSRSGGSTGSA